MDKQLLLSKKEEPTAKISKIDKGLLTQVPSKLVSIKSEGCLFKDLSFGNIIEEKKQTLACLFSLNCALTNRYSNGKVMDRSSRIFCPTIAKVVDKKIINLGSFQNTQQHMEAIEACRAGQAFVYPNAQSAIIYFVDELLDSDFFDEEKIQELNGMLDANYKAEFSLKVPVFYDMWN